MQNTATKSAPRKSTDSPVAKLLAARMEASCKTQRQIAAEAGFPNPNILSMIKKGARVPLGRVFPLAEALDIDPIFLLRLTWSEYDPKELADVERILGPLVTAAERTILQTMREAGFDDRILTEAQAAELKSCLLKWRK